MQYSRNANPVKFRGNYITSEFYCASSRLEVQTLLLLDDEPAFPDPFEFVHIYRSVTKIYPQTNIMRNSV